MSCRRVRRELVDRFRFGELDQRSAPHLAHLESCAGCREEVGIDQLFVRQLRRALQARVSGYAPSPRAWDEVRARAFADGGQAPRSRIPRLAFFVRTTRALAAGSALVLAMVLTSGAMDQLDLGFDDRPAPGFSARATVREPLQWASFPAQPIDRYTVLGHVVAIPSISMPRPAGVTPYAEIVTAMRVGTPPDFPSVGGVIQ